MLALARPWWRMFSASLDLFFFAGTISKSYRSIDDHLFACFSMASAAERCSAPGSLATAFHIVYGPKNAP